MATVAGESALAPPGATPRNVLTEVPPDLLAAVSAEPGGRLVIVTGAGSSIEAPTSLRSGREYSETAHASLVADRVLQAGDCTDPTDLSVLADAVYSKTGGQTELTRRLPREDWRAASPNDGHLAVAALLIEGAVRAVVTLNYDLALQAALSQLGKPPSITICKGPEDYDRNSGHTLFYLHRSAESDETKWVLRKEDLETAWHEAWEELVASGTLSAPVTLFAGLGSPAAVLTDTVKRLAAVGHTSYFYGDPYPENKFRESLEPNLTAVLQIGWCELMLALSRRTALAQVHRLRIAAADRCAEQHMRDHLVNAAFSCLADVDLVALGSMRAAWLLHAKNYLAEQEGLARVRMADLLLAVGAMADRLSAVPRLAQDQSAVLTSDGEAPLTFHCAHGGGVHSWVAIEERLRHRLRRSLTVTPRTVLVSGLCESANPLAESLVRPTHEDDLVRGPDEFVAITVAEVHQLLSINPDELRRRFTS